MREHLRKLIIKELDALLDKFKANTTDLTEDEAMDLLSVLFHQAMSKEEAADYLRVSIPTFNNYIALGKVPKGRKRKGHKELVWYKDELINMCKG